MNTQKPIRNNLLEIIFCFSITLFSFSYVNAKTIRYVKENGTGDGSSWTNAANNIQTMIDNSNAGDEVWVSSGMYKPTRETTYQDSRSRTFLLKSKVNLYGGFSGSESDLSQRTLSDLDMNGKVDSFEFVNKTILSGDIDGVNDVWTKNVNANGTWYWRVSGNSGNCYKVVTCLDNNSIDGFFVTGSNKLSGIYANNSCKITSCTVVQCFSQSEGSGIYAYSSSSISNCFVSKSSGSGIYAYYSSLYHCVVKDCNGSFGGGINAYSCLISRCYVSNCSANSSGGGISIQSSYYSNSIVSDCIVDNCSATEGGGINVSTSSHVADCQVTNCFAEVGGGIIASSLSTMCSVKNSKIANCLATSKGGGIYLSSYAFMANSAILNCSAYEGGGVFSASPYNASSATWNCTIYNCSGNYGGGVSATSSVNKSTYFTNCVFANCSATYDGSAILGDLNTEITNCASINNSTAGVVSVGIVGGRQNACIYTDITSTFVKPADFIGIANNALQKEEILLANMRLKENSLCFNAGTTTNVYDDVLSSKDLDGNPRFMYGSIDIGAYEYVQELTNDTKIIEQNKYKYYIDNGTLNVKGVNNSVIQVFNMQGKIMLTQFVGSDDFSFQLYSSGIYFVNILCNKRKEILKIIW